RQPGHSQPARAASRSSSATYGSPAALIRSAGSAELRSAGLRASERTLPRVGPVAPGAEPVTSRSSPPCAEPVPAGPVVRRLSFRAKKQRRPPAIARRTRVRSIYPNGAGRVEPPARHLEATAAGPARLPLQRGSSTHLLGCGDPHEAEPAPDDLGDSHREFQPGPRKLWIIFNEEAARRIVVAAVPQCMELRREIIEVESYPVRLVRHGGAFDHP